MEKNENIEIKRIIDILSSKKIIIVLLLILFTAIGYLYSYYYVVPEYKSVETLLLIPNNVNESQTVTSSDLTLNSGLITTYSNIAKNSKVLNKVINNLYLDMTEEELSNKMQISIVKDTHIMEISVTDTNPQLAMEITKEVSKVFLNEIKEIYNLNNIGIVDEAQVSNTPYNINHIKDILMFVVLGIFASGLYVLLVYILDNTIKSGEDIERYVKIKTLGNIPINQNKKKEIIERNDAKSYITECINTIRTNILYMNSTQKAKTILITSCTPKEGKSWVSANIATAFADTNQKVLLIDADMRKGRANKIFKVDSTEGLSNYLYNITGDVKKDIELGKKYIKETSIPNLHILTNGTIPPNPSELLASSSMKELMALLKNTYDILIIDAPPCKLVSDSIILSTIADSTILVANSEKTKIKDLKEVKKLIDNVGGKIIGAIINKKKVGNKTYSKNYYYGHSKSKHKYEMKENKIITVNEVIDEAIVNLKKKDFNIFFDENEILLPNPEEINNIDNTEYQEREMQEVSNFIKRHDNYLERVANIVSDIQVQLNSSNMKARLKNDNYDEDLESAITKKIEEWQQKNSEEIKNEIKNTNNAEELGKISNQLEKVKTNYEDILGEIKKNDYSDKMEEVFSEINNVKSNYNTLMKEIKEINNTDEILKEMNKDNLTSDQIKEILKEEISNISYTDEIEKIYNEIRDAKSDYKQLMQDIKEVSSTESLIDDLNKNRLTREEVQEILREEIYILEEQNKSRLTKKQVEELLKEEIANINNNEEIYNKISDVKSDYSKLIKELVSSNNTRIEEMQEETKKVVQQQISSIDYTEQINQMNEMIENLKDSYLELSNIIRTNHKEDINSKNVIDIKSLKKQKTETKKEEDVKKERNKFTYPIDKDISYSELEKTAMWVVSTKPKTNKNASSESYESFM